MKDDVFELVEIDDGQIVLKRPNDSNALIKVDIGTDMADQLSMSPIEFVRTMLEAGFSEAADQVEAQKTSLEATLEKKVLH